MIHPARQHLLDATRRSSAGDSDLFARVQSAAHDADTSPFSRRPPTQAQLEANSYRTGRVDIQGLPIRIETPRGARREKPGKFSNLMLHHYGDVAGTVGNDGDPIDVFIGPFPELPVVYVVNQVGRDRAFDEHKVCMGFASEADARMGYLSAYAPGWDGLDSIVRATMAQFKWWLKYGDKSRPFTPDVLPYEGQTTMDKVLWNSQAEPVTKPLNTIIYELRGEDAGHGLMLDALSMSELMADPDIEAVPVLDAMVVEVGRLQPKMEILQRIMAAAGETVKPTEMAISDPVRYKGAAQVMVLFTMSDGQTVSVWFHNPDTTPAKLMPLDELISWKWMLNKKDVTIVVAPERGRDLNPREVSRRIMRLVERNSAAFLKANAKVAEKAAQLQALDTEIAELQTELTDVQRQIEVAKVEKEKRVVADDSALREKMRLGQLMVERSIEVRKELLKLGWDNDQAGGAEKNGAKWGTTAEFAPGTENVIGLLHVVTGNVKQAYTDPVRDDLSLTPAELARELDMYPALPQVDVAAPQGLSDAEMVVLIAAAGWKPSFRKQTAINYTGIDIAEYDRVLSALNASGRYMRRSAITSDGSNVVDAYMPSSSTDKKLSSFKGKFAQQDGQTGQRSPAVERAYAIAGILMTQYGWSKSDENEYPETGILVDSPRDSTRWVLLEEQRGVLSWDAAKAVMERAELGNDIDRLATMQDADIAQAFDRADFDAEAVTDDDGLIEEGEEFAGKTPAFAYAAEILRKGAAAAGATVQFGDFSGSTTSTLFDKATPSSPYAEVSVYGITAQIGAGGQVLARAMINEKGEIGILKGAGGMDALGDPRDEAGVRQIVADLMAAEAAKPVPEPVPEPAPTPEPTDAEKVDAAYKFANASDAFKSAVVGSIDQDSYSPFLSAKNIDEAAKKHGATVTWRLAMVLDSVGEAGDDEDPDEDDDFDVEAEFDACPDGDDAVLDALILDGDHPGHAFRGNQHVSASGESRSAVRSSQRAKHAEKHGDPKAQKKAHKTAYFSHMAAAEEAKGVTRSYHRKMAKFHGGRAGVVLDSVEESLILDDADAYESIVGTIKKGSKIVGRAHVGGDGKAMIFLGKTGNARAKYVSPVDGVMREFMWSDDDVGDMVDALFTVPENGVAKAEPVVEAWTKPLVSTDGLAALCESRGITVDVFMTLDYAGGKAVTGATLERDGVRATLEWKAGSQSYNLRSIGERDGEFDAGSSVLSSLLDSFVGWQDSTKEVDQKIADDEISGTGKAIKQSEVEGKTEKEIKTLVDAWVSNYYNKGDRGEAVFVGDKDEGGKWSIIESERRPAGFLVIGATDRYDAGVNQLGARLEKLVKAEGVSGKEPGRRVPGLLVASAGKIAKLIFHYVNGSDARRNFKSVKAEGADVRYSIEEKANTGTTMQDPQKAADTAYLNSLINGTGDLLAEDTFEKLEPMFTTYEGDAEMMALLEQAAQAYGDAAVEAAKQALAA